MTRKNSNNGEGNDRQAHSRRAEALGVTVLSFGYKEGDPPSANMVFDVRFLKNPYWVPELRPLSGLDASVREYVLDQELAGDFLHALNELLDRVLPRFAELELGEFSIAFGCTGGQHRSVAIAETISTRVKQRFPEFEVVQLHRELTAQGRYPADSKVAAPLHTAHESCPAESQQTGNG